MNVGSSTGKTHEEKLSALKTVIEQDVFISNKARRSTDAGGNDLAWIMDFRRVLMRGDILSLVAELFLEKFNEQKISRFQIGGLESAAIPLVAGVVLKSWENGVRVNGFFIRKSRKKSGLLQMVEGVVGDEEIVLVDDLLSSGNSIIKQVNVLESLGKKVSHVCVILQFRNTGSYTQLQARGIAIHALFTLDEFAQSLGLQNIANAKGSTPAFTPLSFLWCFTSPGAAYEHVLPKSSPLLRGGKLYFGSDNGTFWCINTKDGSTVWQRRVLHGPQGKRIFSSPAILGETVFFGGYDGNFYALDAQTGKPRWVAFEADWIGSSPCVSEELGLVFVGMEFGFWKEQGGIAAYDAHTGAMVWKKASTKYTHGSPAYSKKDYLVVCGSNDGIVYGLKAKNGTELWRYDTGGEVKACPAFSPNEKLVAIGTFSKKYVILDAKTGSLVATLTTLEANYSTPVWLDDDVVIYASLDKHIYAFSVSKEEVLWKYATSGRIFSSPIISSGRLYIGNNEGVLFILDPHTGTCISRHHVIERITNGVIVDQHEGVVYVPTQANQILKATLPTP